MNRHEKNDLMFMGLALAVGMLAAAVVLLMAEGLAGLAADWRIWV